MKNRKKELELLNKKEDPGKSPIELVRKIGDIALCGKKTQLKYNGFTGKGRVWTIS